MAFDRHWAGGKLERQAVIAFVLSVFAVAARWSVDPWVGDRHEFLPAYVAVALASWFGSWRAGILAAALYLVAAEFLFEASPNPVDHEAFHVARAIAVFCVICGLIIYFTRRVARSENELQDKVERLEEANHRKSDFLSLVAHELRNPLSAITLEAGLLKKDTLEPRIRESTWQMLDRQAEHMNQLIEDLMDATRIEQGKLVLHREILDVAAAVEDAIADVSGFAEAKQLKMVRQLQRAGSVFADRVRMSQILGNLLHNACKFSAEGGVIAVQVTPAADQVVISVKDAGLGIPSSDLEAIFDSFVQLAPSSGQPQGLGLGLALTKKLVELHGGTVEARSEGLGRGAEFIVRLPRGLPNVPRPPGPDGTSKPVPAEPVDQPANPGALRLLVVDDNPDAAESLAVLLRLKGHEASTAHDGRSALQAARQEHPDLVFLDIDLPDMTGHEVAMNIRRQSQGKQPVLVALTGWGTVEDRSRSKAAGFDCHLAKPISGRQIDEALALRAGMN